MGTIRRRHLYLRFCSMLLSFLGGLPDTWRVHYYSFGGWRLGGTWWRIKIIDLAGPNLRTERAENRKTYSVVREWKWENDRNRSDKRKRKNNERLQFIIDGSHNMLAYRYTINTITAALRWGKKLGMQVHTTGMGLTNIHVWRRTAYPVHMNFKN